MTGDDQRDDGSACSNPDHIEMDWHLGTEEAAVALRAEALAGLPDLSPGEGINRVHLSLGEDVNLDALPVLSRMNPRGVMLFLPEHAHPYPAYCADPAWFGELVDRMPRLQWIEVIGEAPLPWSGLMGTSEGPVGDTASAGLLTLLEGMPWCGFAFLDFKDRSGRRVMTGLDVKSWGNDRHPPWVLTGKMLAAVGTALPHLESLLLGRPVGSVSLTLHLSCLLHLVN